MSFRKRNVALSSGRDSAAPPSAPGASTAVTLPPSLPGLRPSPLDGRPTTSTGTPTLDALLAGHAGLPLGTSILIEESGTTDYAGALLRYYSAEGLVQGHQVHVLGVPEQWGRELPGLVEGGEGREKQGTTGAAGAATEKLKIAWRYERLGQSGTGIKAREPTSNLDKTGTGSAGSSGAASTTFCHTFDLTKRLVHPPDSIMTFPKIAPSTKQDESPFRPALAQLSSILASSPSTSVHRLVVPSLLSPALYPPHASSPEHVLQFLHGIRALLSTYPGRLTAMHSLPLSLYARSSGLVRWMELLSDGVVELSPFPHSYQADAPSTMSGGPAASFQDEAPQGLLRFHRLPIFHERGGGGTTTVGEDWTFCLSRRRFTIKPFSLPPVGGDLEAQQAAAGSGGKDKKADLDF